MVKQVVTLQLGNRANYVGTHFWNLQRQLFNNPERDKELNPSALFRETIARSSSPESSFLPRLQIVDASGAFGSLSTDTASIRAVPTAERAHRDACSAWSGYSQVFFRDQISPHRLSLNPHSSSEVDNSNNSPHSKRTSPLAAVAKGTVRDQEVSYWSDFLSLPLHSQSCHPLPGVHHDVTDLSQFLAGTDIVTALILDDLCDNARTFVEECDNFGGLLMLTNGDDAFAGVTSSYLSALIDELGASTPVLLFSVHQPGRLCTGTTAAKLNSKFETAIEARLAQNEAHLVSACMSHDVQYVPISPTAAMFLPACQYGQSGSSVPPYSSLHDYQTTALPALAMHASLSPLLAPMTLSGLIASVHTANSATYTCLFSNIPQCAAAVVKGQDFVTWDGTINMSDMWSFSDVNNVHGRTSERYNMRMDVLTRRNRCVTTFGFPEVSGGRETYLPHLLQKSMKIQNGVALPVQFPPVLKLANSSKEMHSQGFEINGNEQDHHFQQTLSDRDAKVTKTPRNSDVAIAAGLVDDRTTAAIALRGLSSSLNVNWLTAGDRVFDKFAVEELREDLTSRADDLDE